MVPEPPTRVLVEKGAYETRFAFGGNQGSRAHNINMIAADIDDVVLKPGAEWSFNKHVGPRTTERGFGSAPGLNMGEVVQTVGGGSCQVSSTLYAAALYVGLDIVQRRSHSRPSRYIGKGLDAVVNYPKECWDTDKPDRRICFDLIFVNPFDFDLHLKSNVGGTDDPKKNFIRISFLGDSESKTPRVATRWATYRTVDFETRYRRVKWWKDDRKRRKQHGSIGIEGVLWVIRDGVKSMIRSYYQPTPEVWLVGQTFEVPEDPEMERSDERRAARPEVGEGGRDANSLGQ